jgi:outer membrane protein TolC
LGDATAFDVRDAEDTLRDASLALVVATLERDRARLDLAYANGGLEE